MSVLVKGMEKPEHCGYCRFRYDGICHALQKTRYSMDECPLIGIDEDVIKSQPSVLPKRGRWLPVKRCDGGYWVCSSCKNPTEAFAANVLYKHCPFCGARMDGEENG